MKRLVTYFSASGVTRKAAEELAAVAKADIHEIKPAEPYTREDLDWRNKKSRSSLEMQNEASRPALDGAIPDLSEYDTVYIGFPIWWGVAPRVVNTFIENSDLKDKDLIVFATSGGSGLEYAVNDLRKRYPGLNIRSGRLVKGKVTEDMA
ncbi:MAG TPA: flavodoxin [Candidatus Ornithospirochaeta stercorigallinarum]|nr:flavodoxin [Candidatus Ornithospirochaeta stercorigallinarum]